ncbi:MAG TPA: hypothetical protein VGS22_16100 [Thermoanaerobaculia bacterium]|nr:hypothetical protein [Thermoanaerobaculia bacterium]
MSTSAGLRLEQAIYGSRSGDRDYRILAASPGVARADRDLLEQHANLGGTALISSSVEPIYSAFPLDPRSGRQAFSRAVVLGPGGRGNDYLVHALILSPDLLQTLRGDLFLLDDAGLFGERKPEGEELPVLDLDPGRWELASRRSCGADRPLEVGLEHLAPLLAALAEGPLAVQVADGTLGLALCRALLSALPPDDRTSLGFCSRFCQPRALPYRFSAFVPEDRALAERYLRGAVRPLGPPTEGPIAQWLAAAKVQIEPVFGLSLLRDPGRAVAQVRLLQTLPDTGQRRARARDGNAESRATEEVLEIARHPANAALPRLGGQLLGILAHGLEQSAKAALAAGDPAPLFAECGKTLAEARPLDLIDELRADSGLAARTAETAVALSASDPAPFRASFGRAERDLAVWLAELLVHASGFALPFLALAFSRWRELEGNAALGGISALLAGLPGDVPLTSALAAIERAAPAGQGEERRTWFRSYLRLLLPWLGTRVPEALAARIAGQEGLLEEMGAGDLESLVPVLATSLPQLLDRDRLVALPDTALESFLQSAARGFDGSDLERHPARVQLAERLAARSAERLAEQAAAGGPRPELVRGALALIQAAAGHVEVDRAPFRSALVALLRARPAGLTASVARAAARLRRRFGPFPSFEPRELAAIRAQAFRDARESAPRGAGWPVLVWAEALEARGTRV